jgi:hypothetical protein
MGQIVSSAAKPKRCNLQSLSSFGTPAAGEHILVSSDNSMNAAGQGNFDAYVVGDGTTAAGSLPLFPVEKNGYYNNSNVVYTSLADAIASVPVGCRKLGLHLVTNISGEIKDVYYIGTSLDSWTKEALWINNGDKASVVNGDFLHDYQDGKMLNNGNISSAGNSRITNPIFVAAGTKVILYTGCNDANVWSVLEFHTTSEIVRATLISRVQAPSTRMETYEVTAPQDCYVIMSCGNYRGAIRNAFNDSYYLLITTKSGLIYQSDIVNTLNSEDTDKPLSAAQGKALGDDVAALQTEYLATGNTEEVDISDVFNFVPNSRILVANGSANGEETGKLQYKAGYTSIANDNYIDISGYTQLSISILSETDRGMCIYDINHNVIDVVKDTSNVGSQVLVTIPILPTYKYIRTTISDASTFSCVLSRPAFVGLQKINEENFGFVDLTDKLLYGGRTIFNNVSILPRVSGTLAFYRSRIRITAGTNTFILFRIPSGVNNKMYVKASTNGSTIYLFKEFIYEDNAHVVATCADGYESTNIALTASEEKTMYLPADCCYVAMVYNTGRADTTNYYPQKVVFESNGAITELNKVNNIQQFYSAVETNVLEQMAHKNTTFYYSGSFYSLYMCDDTQYEEYVPNHTTIKVRLGIRSILDIDNAISTDIFQVKKKYGDILVSDYAPSNCGMAITSDSKYLYMYANVRPQYGELETAVMRKFSIMNKLVESDCYVLKLNGDTFTLSKVIECYNTAMGTSISTTQSGTSVWGLNLSSQICLASDGNYYWGIGASVSNFGGIIIKSTDLINWTFVTAYDLSGTTSTTVWEIALAETETGVLTVAERANMIYVGAYNFSNNTWVKNPTALANTLATRPFFFKYSNKTYMVCNINGASSYATRANIGIYEVTSAGEVSSVMTKQVVTGCHYAEVVEANSELYIFYSSDPKRVNRAQAASKIVCEKLTLS